MQEDDIHIFFTCPFARVAWFTGPWNMRSDLLVQNSDSLVNIISNLVNSNHPQATLSNIFSFMWCIRKSRNDNLFQRKDASPLQIFYAAHAITESLSLEVQSKMPGKIDHDKLEQSKHDEQKLEQ